jgi:hypothetical protein
MAEQEIGSIPPGNGPVLIGIAGERLAWRRVSLRPCCDRTSAEQSDKPRSDNPRVGAKLSMLYGHFPGGIRVHVTARPCDR